MTAARATKKTTPGNLAHHRILKDGGSGIPAGSPYYRLARPWGQALSDTLNSDAQFQVLPVTFQPVEHLADAAGGQRDARVGGAVVEPKGVAVGLDRVSAGKHNVVYVAKALVVGLGAEHPGVAATQTLLGRVEIQQRQADAVEFAGGRGAHAVIDQQPAGGRFYGRGGQADLLGVPPGAAAGSGRSACGCPSAADRASRRSRCGRLAD